MALGEIEDYKSLCAAVRICSILVIQTHTHTYIQTALD